MDAISADVAGKLSTALKTKALNIATALAGGGRIAIGICLTDAQIDELAATGTLAGRPMERRLATDAFLAENPGVTVNVEDGAGLATGIYAGTFRVLDFRKTSTLLEMR